MSLFTVNVFLFTGMAMLCFLVFLLQFDDHR